MKLIRFNENKEIYFINNKENDKKEKNKIIEKLSLNWSEKLKQKYIVPKSLYNYTLDYLKQLEKHYLNENIENSTINNVKIIEPKNKELESILVELKTQHLSNEAVENIRIEGNDIIFDVKCETDIQGITNYKGYNLKYNKLCEININEEIDKEILDNQQIDEEIDEEIDNNIIFEQINNWKIKL
jgi:hypothetical protein